MDETLFPLPEAQEPTPPSLLIGKPRLNRAQREQLVWRPVNLDSLVPEEHEVRLVWEWVLGIDLSPLLAEIRAVEGGVGRTAIDPAILVALWLYATLQGVGSARQLDRLCQEHLAYLWLCGGVSVNYHTLADFRVEHQEFLEQLFIHSIAALQTEGLVTLQEVAQDGKKIRASAGSGSFHKQETLEQHLEAATQQVEALRQQLEEHSQQLSKRQQQARQRAARERVERLNAAKQQLEKIEKRAEKTGRAKKDQKAGKERRASETDPQARVMKMADGGFRPAYNCQFLSDMKANIIVGMQVSQQGNDFGLASPLLKEVVEQQGIVPKKLVTDSGYFSLGEIVTLSQAGCTPYIDIPGKSKADEHGGDTRYLPKEDDPEEVVELRKRMSSEAGKAKLKERGAVAELVHAVMDQWNLARVRVRGLQKVKTVLLWFVLAHNWIRARLLRKKLAQKAAAA